MSAKILAIAATVVLLGTAFLRAHQSVHTVFGTGVAGHDDRETTTPFGFAVGPDGALYFCEMDGQRVRRLEQRGAVRGYSARIDPVAAGLPLAAFVSIQPIDPAAPDDAPDRLRHLTAIEACHSVAGTESYILQVRVAGPAELEQLLQEIRAAAGVSTRTTVVLSTPWEGRPPPPQG